MIIKPQSIEKLKEVFVKILLSRTDDVTKVTDASVLNGIAYGAAKLGQKALKDIALTQSHFYPKTAYGQYLDNIAEMYGISPRFASRASSTYLRIVGDVGTTYVQGVHQFKGSNGIIWDLDSASVIIGPDGFTYAKVVSTTTGADTLVEALTINQVNPIPVGHQYVINEYQALGGCDNEEDEEFRDRIVDAINLLARPTLSYLKQVMLKFRPDILRVFNYGDNGLGRIKLAIATVSGADLTPAELTDLTNDIAPWLSLDELNPDGLGFVGVELTNITWEPVDISFRVQIDPAYDPDKVRKDIQVRMNKDLDYRTWVSGSKVEWDDLLQIAKSTEGVVYVPDQYFFPSQDLSTDYAKLPRVRGFQMLDLEGAIISNGSGTLNPVFYPTVADFSFIATVLGGL